MRVFFSNLGCKLNQAEVDSLARQFLVRGHEIVGSLTEADLHVVNSCTVTAAAARDSRKIARRGGRLDRSIRTILTGCWATDSEEEAKALEGVDLVVPNASKDRVPDLILERFPELRVQGWEASEVPVSFVPLPLGPTRGLVKIEDGCNMRCAFCIIPRTRGAQRSRALGEVITEIQSLHDGGYAEVIITGVQISSYRSDEHRLFDLVREALEQTEIGRLRLSSIAPWEFDERLLDLLEDPRLCRHLHLSLQSGSAETLRRMRRPYSPLDFRRLVETVRQRIPGIAVTTDVIVGFPGESEEEFAESLDFVTDMQFARSHVFVYSPRPGTAAAALSGDVAPEIKKGRMRAMRRIAFESAEGFRLGQIGLETGVVWEEGVAGSWRGMTDNYIRARADSEVDLRGLLTPATLVAEHPDGALSAVPHCRG